MDDYIYNGIVNNIAQAFLREVDCIVAEYNYDYGDEFEIAVCKFLRKFLPLKYGVCRGFVVDKHGNKAGDDIIIYDQELYPTLRFIERENLFSNKEQIPVEAVYAYIEVKYTLNSESINKAAKQVYEVKKLCYSRSANLLNRPYKIGMSIFDNEYSKSNGWNPIIQNPVYGMIISANCVGLNGKRTLISKESANFVVHEINGLKDYIHSYKHLCFDSIIAGNSTTAFCGHYIFDDLGKLKDGILLTRFYTGIEPNSCYQVSTHENMAYGLGIAHLMMALNYIQLGQMPWDLIFNTAKMPDKDERDNFEKVINNI